MVRRRSVNRRVRAAGIVGDHSTQSRARARRHIRTEAKAMRTEKLVQVVEDYARPDADRAVLQVEVADFAIVARKVNDQPLTERASDQAGASSSGNHRHTRLCRSLDDRA